jgi:hypothetical protein
MKSTNFSFAEHISFSGVFSEHNLSQMTHGWGEIRPAVYSAELWGKLETYDFSASCHCPESYEQQRVNRPGLTPFPYDAQLIVFRTF